VNRARVVGAALTAALTAALAGCAVIESGPDDVLSQIATRQQVEEAAAEAAAVTAKQSAVSAAAAVKKCSPGAEASFPPLAALPAPGRAAAGTLVAKIYNRGYLVVGVSGDTRLLGARDALKGGRLEGFDIELAMALARAVFGDPNAEARIRFKVITAGERFSLVNAGVEKGGVDIVARAVSMTCDRWQDDDPAKGSLFSAGYFKSDQRLLVRKDLAVKGVADLKPGLNRVCAPTGSTSLVNLARNRNVVPIAAEIHSDCLALWQEGKVDAVTGDDAILAGFADQDPRAQVVGGAMDATYYGFAVGRGQEHLVQFVNAVMETPGFRAAWTSAHSRYLAPRLGAQSLPAPNYSRPLGR
jgi:polar amino acid transport system substrate-binding protein